ncbi:MAG: 1-deoxy-D-xylulose-5-phosphate reductoisomerase [Gammaproteobacteria bacterium]|nr:1-deoxy-D-xylulose-5-phosphate reductoisomerase [Gammaproteobacteria bacterium]
MSVQRITVLGSTGSVGKNTLDVILRHPERYQVVALTANDNVDLLLEQCRAVAPAEVVLANADAAERMHALLASAGLQDINVSSGQQALAAVVCANDTDTVMSAIVGAAGLQPTFAAVQAGKRVLIANKEPLVMTGDLFMREAGASGATILPIDSEHNAIFQCLPADLSQQGVRRIHLTASGGPFRGQAWSDLRDITPEQACAHPNWSMGAKISVDSATMMNKGLELIEAAALFGIDSDRVDILVHPQSIIHSLVEYSDGSFLAQLGAPDMRIPIAHALAWPERIESGADTLNLAAIARLDFVAPDMVNLPCLRLARAAAAAGQSAPASLNAANEVAVAAFLDRTIRYTDLATVIDSVMQQQEIRQIDSIESVLHIDNEARDLARRAINSL